MVLRERNPFGEQWRRIPIRNPHAQGNVRNSSALHLVDLRGENEIALRQPIDFMRPDGYFGPTPCEQNIGMMSLFLGNSPDAVHEIQRLPKVGKSEVSREVMFVNYLPLRNLLSERL
jgi:hypothetical protein